ncbi:A/G-specific adenine glycosylase [Patescibacteria group bacterium]|nr:A/G-specific adenine glycosylase [Patescibacteria group bacterium]
MTKISQFQKKHDVLIASFESALKKKEKKQQGELFQQIIYQYYDVQGRDLPWRKAETPYHVFISEVMLQQTQVDRVIEKYLSWIKKFPDFNTLSNAPFSEVLSEWHGLGYNRRARFLHESAKKAVAEYNGTIPSDPKKLEEFPGIGPATAASICAFGFNKPTVFIETNVRSVYIHFFFPGEDSVKDDDIMTLVEETLDTKNPCRWYNALMDYGTYLKARTPNPSRKSRHHTKQKSFKGSNREIRGLIIKNVLSRKKVTEEDLIILVGKEKNRVEENINVLLKEGFLSKEKTIISVTT